MKSFHSKFIAVLAICFGAVFFTFAGCGQSSNDGSTVSSAPPAANGAHDHPTEGPHQGGLIELGNEEYHAEFVHDEASGAITVYVLDSAAQNTVPIDATELLVNLSHDGQAEQFSLAANPERDDAAGKSSRFTSSEQRLAEELDHEQVEAELVVVISGKQYRGDIHHDHEDHAH